MKPAELKTINDGAIEQNIGTLRNRINQLGVAEPIIQQQGAGRIVVELPGVQDTAQAKKVLGATATLEYRANVDGNALEAAATGNVPNHGCRATAATIRAATGGVDARASRGEFGVVELLRDTVRFAERFHPVRGGLVAEAACCTGTGSPTCAAAILHHFRVRSATPQAAIQCEIERADIHSRRACD